MIEPYFRPISMQWCLINDDNQCYIKISNIDNVLRIPQKPNYIFLEIRTMDIYS